MKKAMVMKNLMKKIATSVGLTLVAASLMVISPDQAQAKVKKKAGNSAKLNSQAKRLSVRNGNKFLPEIGDEVLVSQSKRRSAGNGKTYQSMSDQDTAVVSKRSKARNGNVQAVYDLLKAKP